MGIEYNCACECTVFMSEILCLVCTTIYQSGIVECYWTCASVIRSVLDGMTAEHQLLTY